MTLNHGITLIVCCEPGMVQLEESAKEVQLKRAVASDSACY